MTIVCEPRHDIDKGHLVNNLEELNGGTSDNKRNGLTNRIDQESPSINPFTSLLLSKNRREQACLCKVIKEHQQARSHTDKGRKGRLRHSLHIVS